MGELSLEEAGTVRHRTVTLLDSAVGCAVHSSLERGQAYTTLELKVTSSGR